MESGCSIFTHPSSVLNGVGSFRNASTLKSDSMDCVSSTSDSIIINSESSKDGSASSYDDASNLRPEENGITDDLTLSKKPTITLAKSVTLKNFESMSTNVIVNASDIEDRNEECGDNAEESINLNVNALTDVNIEDPLANSIILSESDGEGATKDLTDAGSIHLSNDVVLSDSAAPVASRIQARASSSDDICSTSTAALPKDSNQPSISDNSDVEILSADTPQQRSKSHKVSECSISLYTNYFWLICSAL